MKRLAIIATLVAAPALASSDTDYPHRDWGQIATIDMPIGEATACIAREMTKAGKVLILPADGGNDIDFYMGSILGGGSGDPWERFQLRPSGESTVLRALYRHPYKASTVSADVRRMGKHCLKVLKVGPA